MAPLLAYWDIRGVANPIRMLLHYANVRFEDKQYELDNYAESEWFSEDKPALQKTLDFPNLPYYIDGMVQITHSMAILQYLGRKHKLNGANETELVRIDVIVQQMKDHQNGLAQIAYPPATISNRDAVYETLRKEYAGSLAEKLARIANFLGDDDWVAGARLTYADFYVYDILDYHRLLFDAKHLNAHPVLVAYMERFEALAGVKEFLGSDKFDRLPIFSKYALFGNVKDYKPLE